MYRPQDLSRDDRTLWNAQKDKNYIKVGVGVIRHLKGDVNAALLICHLDFLSEAHAGREGWFWRTQQQIEAWTGMSEGVQLRARKRLESVGLLETALRGVPARVYYRVNVAALIELAKVEAENPDPGFGTFKILDSADQGNQFLQDEDTGSCRLQEPAPADYRNINKEEIKDQIISTQPERAIPHTYGAEPEQQDPEPVGSGDEQARLSPTTPPQSPPSPPTAINGWKAEDLAKLRGIVAAEYPDSGPGGYRPGKAALDKLSSVPKARGNDFVKAVRNYARKVQGEDTRWTRGLARFLEDGFWEQFVVAQSLAKKPSAPSQSAVRDINGEADAVSHAVKRANVYIPAFDKNIQEAS